MYPFYYLVLQSRYILHLLDNNKTICGDVWTNRLKKTYLFSKNSKIELGDTWLVYALRWKLRIHFQSVLDVCLNLQRAPHCHQIWDLKVHRNISFLLRWISVNWNLKVKHFFPYSCSLLFTLKINNVRFFSYLFVMKQRLFFILFASSNYNYNNAVIYEKSLNTSY